MKHTLTLLTALLLALLAALHAADEPAKKPNILLIVCDDLNSYIEGFGGHPQAKTPNLARLRDSGVSFLQAHCTSPICAPSRSSFLTGLYPHTSRNYGFDKWFDNEVLKNSRTLMDHFRANGYHTLGTGKLMHQEVTKEWSEWGNDVDYGPFAFDGKENVAHPDVPAPLRNDFGAVDGSFGPLVKLEGRTFKDGKTYSWRTGNWKGMRPLRVESDDDRDLTADELNRDWAVAKLKGFASHPGGKPFFMGVGFIRPHTPIIVPQRFFDLFPLASVKLPVIKPGDVEDTFLRTVSGTDQGDLDRGAKIYQSLVASYGSKEEALKRFIQAYLASVAADDEHIGQILDVIDNSPLKDNTIIILTSDHGWQMGQKDYVYKNSLWEESTRVPLIIRVPGVTKGGATSHPVSLVDLYPTLVDLCGLTGDTRKSAKGRPLDGHSLKPFLLDPNTEKWAGPDAALTTLFRWAKTYNPSEQSYTLRSKDWRYIRYSNGKEELYDHVNDPHEWTNLAGKPEHAARLAMFRQQLDARIPKTQPQDSQMKPAGEAWKDEFFKQHPDADANKDGVLSWPEYKEYKKKLDAGEVGKPKAGTPAAPGRLQTSGTFSKTADGGLIFTDQAGGQVYYAIKELASAVEPHLEKPVKIVANVKDSTKGKAKVMVYLVSIQAREAGNPETKAETKAPAAADNPAPQKTDAEAWKDNFFKQHPDADTNKDGTLSWPEYKAHKAKLDAEKAKNKPQP